MKVELQITEAEAHALKLLRRHFPPWFREDSNGCGTHEQHARDVLDRLIRKVTP